MENVEVPGPRRHQEADRRARRPRDEGRRRLPARRQDAAQGRPSGVPARVHLRGRRRHLPASSRRCRRTRPSCRRPARSLRKCAPNASIDVRSPAKAGERRRRLSSRPSCCPSASAGLAALSEVNFEVARGEIRAIIGPNGAGKSTFFNCLTGVLRPSGGRIIFNGEDITGLPSEHDLAKGHRALLPDHQYPAQRHGAGKRAHRRAVAPPRLEHGRASWRASPTSMRRPKPRWTRSACSARPTNWPPICRTASSAISKSALRSQPSRNCSASTSRPRA